jgi:hypothetical protein
MESILIRAHSRESIDGWIFLRWPFPAQVSAPTNYPVGTT